MAAFQAQLFREHIGGWVLQGIILRSVMRVIKGDTSSLDSYGSTSYFGGCKVARIQHPLILP